jgi:hypothetical protein
VAGGNFHAIATDITGVRRWPLFAIQRFGEEAGSSGFADTARPSKQKGMGNTPASNGVTERAGHVFLAYDSVKGLWSPFPSENEITHNETRNK